MPNLNENIEIGRNYLRYYDEIVKISSISRTYIFRFSNRERKAYENEVAAYENDKKFYEAVESAKKRSTLKSLIIAAAVLAIISVFLFMQFIYLGMAVLTAAIICGFLAYRTAKKDTAYPYPPPEERPYPEKYGLKIEMNSGYSVYFTAVENNGLLALRNLQQDINNADTQQGITVFNMNDNRVSVENNEGIISTGQQSDNKVAQNREKEFVD